MIRREFTSSRKTATVPTEIRNKMKKKKTLYKDIIKSSTA